jgi:hypothetical protein
MIGLIVNATIGAIVVLLASRLISRARAGGAVASRTAETGGYL